MRHDVHFAALKAAARVAFGVAVIGGCNAATETAGDEAQLGESAVNAKEPCQDASPAPDAKGPDATTKPDATSSADASTADAKKSCAEIVAASFPGIDPNEYVWNDPSNPLPALSDDAKACCKAQLLGEERKDYHWACCATTDLSQQEIGFACTPWGPPVPPSMGRRRFLPQLTGVA